MSTHSKLYWTIRCDVCKNTLGNDSYEYTVHDSESDAIVAARDSDWRVLPDMTVCCDCVDNGVVPEGAHAADPDDLESCRWCFDEWPCEGMAKEPLRCRECNEVIWWAGRQGKHVHAGGPLRDMQHEAQPKEASGD